MARTHDKTGEGHGKLVRNLLDIKNEADLTAFNPHPTP